MIFFGVVYDDLHLAFSTDTFVLFLGDFIHPIRLGVWCGGYRAITMFTLMYMVLAFAFARLEY